MTKIATKKITERTTNELLKIIKASETTANYTAKNDVESVEAILELARRINEKDGRKDLEKFVTASRIGNYLTAKMSHLEVEHFMVLILNNKNQKIATLALKDDELKIADHETVYKEFFQQEKGFKYIDEDLVSIGTINQTIAMPREVFRKAVTLNAASIILAHNHPSGDIRPSLDDLQLTRRMKEAGQILGINVLDHFIIGHNSYYSFLENRDL